MPVANKGKAGSPFGRIYLTGQMRSGTTMLANLLNEQDDIFLEADHIRIAGAMRKAFGDITDPFRVLDDDARAKFFLAYANGAAVGGRGPKRLRRLRRFLTDESLARGSNFTTADIAELPPFKTVAHFYRQRAYAERRRGERWVGNKETRAERLAHMLAERDVARAIIILRDPRDSTLSYMRKNEDGRFGGGDSIRRVIELWREGFDVWRRADGKRVLALRYEDLVTDQDATLSRLSGFLETPVRPRELRVNNSSFGDVEKGVVSSNPVGRWREHADHPVVRKVNDTLARELVEAGYDAPRRGGWLWALSRRVTRLTG